MPSHHVSFFVRINGPSLANKVNRRLPAIRSLVVSDCVRWPRGRATPSFDSSNGYSAPALTKLPFQWRHSVFFSQLEGKNRGEKRKIYI